MMKTVRKALDILEVFLNGAKEIGISELAEITGQNISTIHNILIELVRKGYIRQREARGKYSLGLKFLSFSGAVNRIVTMVDIIRPLLKEMSQEVNETANVSINSGNFCISIAMVHGAHTLRVEPTENIGIPLHCTGVGKVFLAARSDAEVEEYIDNQKLKSYTHRTITDPDKLKRQIRKIRREEIAFDDEEYEKGVRNVAAPVKDSSGEVIATVGIVAPAVRVSSSRLRELAPIVKEYAAKISEVIWHNA